MTKKHFIDLADVIREHNSNSPILLKFGDDHIQTIADFCERHNPRFNRERWLGYIAGTNGKNGGAIKQTNEKALQG